MHTFVIVIFAHYMMSTTSLFPLASPHGDLSVNLQGRADRANHEGHYCVCIRMRVSVHVISVCMIIYCSYKWVKTTGTHFVYMCFLCMWMNAHLCLRTLIGCVAIETLTLFWERVWHVSVLSTVYVSYIINISCSVNVWSIRRLVQSVFMGCDHVAFCQLSNLWMKGVELLTLEKRKKNSILLCKCTEWCMKC